MRGRYGTNAVDRSEQAEITVRGKRRGFGRAFFLELKADDI
jgi:hypothetical protein